jgi:hypothetical protein
MNRKIATIVGVPVLVLPTLQAQEAKFVADNLKYSRDFYSKVHFVAIAKLSVSFKYDRYPFGGPERIQCDEGTCTRQYGKPWMHSNDKMRTGLPIDYSERNRYVMTFALRTEWGRTGEPVDKGTARKLDDWIRLVEAALNVTPANAKLLDKSETPDGRDQWVFEASSEVPNGVPTRLVFRKPTNDKNENVLLHEFSGSLRLEGDKMIAAVATNQATLGFGYMMSAQQGYEVSEFVWEEMQRAREEKGASTAKESASPPAAPIESSPDEQAAATTVSLLDGKLKIDIPADFSRDPEDPKDPKTLAKFSGPDSAWGAVLRGTHGLTPEKLAGYLKMRVDEYSKGFKWLPKDSHLLWLKKEIVTIDGRKWADWRYVPMLKGNKDYSNNPVYTRFLTTSYKGQLLEISFTSNLNTSSELKQQIDQIMGSVHLEE